MEVTKLEGMLKEVENSTHFPTSSSVINNLINEIKMSISKNTFFFKNVFGIGQLYIGMADSITERTRLQVKTIFFIRYAIAIPSLRLAESVIFIVFFCTNCRKKTPRSFIFKRYIIIRTTSPKEKRKGKLHNQPQLKKHPTGFICQLYATFEK